MHEQLHLQKITECNYSSMPLHPWGLMAWHNWVQIIRLTHAHALSLLWRHNEHDSVSNHQHYDCLLNRLFRRRPKETSKARVTGLCAENSPETGEFPAQMASNAENVSIWWRHHRSSIAVNISVTSIAPWTQVESQIMVISTTVSC